MMLVGKSIDTAGIPVNRHFEMRVTFLRDRENGTRLDERLEHSNFSTAFFFFLDSNVHTTIRLFYSTLHLNCTALLCFDWFFNMEYFLICNRKKIDWLICGTNWLNFLKCNFNIWILRRGNVIVEKFSRQISFTYFFLKENKICWIIVINILQNLII